MDVDRMVEEFFRPVRGVLDFAFVAGVAYGAERLAGLCYSCLRGFRIYCLPWGRSSRSNLKQKFGKWAVIVGATSEIGQAYAKELAEKGMNVVLISKFYDDLVTLVAQIQSEYSVEAYGIHADFSIGPQVYQEIAEALQDLEIGILVNDACVRYDHPQYFVLVPPVRLLQILDENVSAATLMAYLLLPQMLERQRGAVINICSQIALLPPSPLLSAYTASMVYLKSFSECLHLESRRRGVLVQTLLPGSVASGRWSSLFTPSPATYVSHAMATLGVASTTCGYWPHSLQSWLAGLVPQTLWVWLISSLYRRQRINEINEAKEKGVDQFARRRRASSQSNNPVPRRTSAASAPQPAPLRRVSGDLTLRRSPSPKRKAGNFSLRRSPSPKRRASDFAFRRSPSPKRRPGVVGTPGVAGTPSSHFHISGTPAPLRIQEKPLPSLPGGNIPSPIPESPVTPRFFPQGRSQNQPPSTSTPLSGAAGGPSGGNQPPQMASPALKRPRSPIRYSRVTVMPSLVRYSQQAQLPSSLPIEASPPPPPHHPPPSSSASSQPQLREGERRPPSASDHHDTPTTTTTT